LAALLAGYPVGRPVAVPLGALARKAGLGEPQARHALALLEKSGALTARRPFSGRAIRVVEDVAFADLGLDLDSVREQERRALLLLRRMTDYAYSKKCRRAFILRYFGETLEPGACSGCDACSGRRVEPKKQTGAIGSQPPAAAPGKHSELALLELKRWRRELARDLEIPPYVIFNDTTLVALATAVPTERADFLRIKGTGQSHWERFGAKIREISLIARAAGHSPSAVPLKQGTRRRK
jgi:ATP-dependent DNA helicase RecQ